MMSDRPPFPLRKVITSDGTPPTVLPSFAVILIASITEGRRVRRPSEPFRIPCHHGGHLKVKLSHRGEGAGLSLRHGPTGSFSRQFQGARERSARVADRRRGRGIAAALTGKLGLAGVKGRLRRDLRFGGAHEQDPTPVPLARE